MTMALQQPAPFVTVVIPSRNEERFIAKCLDSIMNNDYPEARMEVLVVDGMSTDRTREIVQDYVQRFSGRLRLLDNRKRILAAAWNLGISQAKGEVVMALNSHGVFRRGYISTCINYLRATDADYVGGVIVTHPQEQTYVGNAIALALSSRFGVGASHFRVGVSEPQWADTAAFGGYRREVFNKIGMFNEELTRSQDMDFHVRMKQAGCRILLVPQMVCDYFVRSNLKTFVYDYFRNGYWVTYPLRVNPKAIYWRHLVPLAFVLSLAATLLVWILEPRQRWLFFLVAGAYAISNTVCSFAECLRRGRLRQVVILPLIFMILHVSYGTGAFVGLIHALWPSSVKRSLARRV